MTAFGSEEVRAEAKRLGVNHFVRKPFGLDEMMTVVRACLGERAEADG
jgi:DNA-binding response OmpR family regulator